MASCVNMCSGYLATAELCNSGWLSLLTVNSLAVIDMSTTWYFESGSIVLELGTICIYRLVRHDFVSVSFRLFY